VLEGYFDESYNSQTFVLGGWIAEDRQFSWLETQWVRRLALENRRLLKQGKQPLSRYHASDCSSRKNEYDGWALTEQISHAKAFLRFISQRTMVAITCGVSLKDLVDVFPKNKHDALEQAYLLCFRQCMGLIARAMSKWAPSERITLFHDRGNIDHKILQEFNVLIDDPEWKQRKYFVTIAPLSWRDSIALQPADLIAFESFKLLDSKLYTQRQMRKSLQNLLGKRVPIVSKYWHREGLERLRDFMDANRDNEDVKASGLQR
jgi:hypothetical protein